MSELGVDSEYMSELLKKPEQLAQDVLDALEHQPRAVDGGFASDWIASIARIAGEAALLSAELTRTTCEVTREAVSSQMATDESVSEDLNRYHAEAFE